MESELDDMENRQVKFQVFFGCLLLSGRGEQPIQAVKSRFPLV